MTTEKSNLKQDKKLGKIRFQYLNRLRSNRYRINENFHGTKLLLIPGQMNDAPPDIKLFKLIIAYKDQNKCTALMQALS